MTEHMKVSKLKHEYEGMRELYKSRNAHLSEESVDLVSIKAKLVDHFYIHNNVMLLCDELRRVHRDVKFIPSRNARADWISGVSVVTELWAYFDEDEYAFMRLGYADYYVRDNNEPRYGIYSRLITNNKFSEAREQYNMVLTDVFDRAVKAAKKYMRRYSPQEVATTTAERIQDKVNSRGWALAHEFNGAMRDVTGHTSFFSELASLVRTGYQFNDPLFNNAVRKMIDRREEMQQKMNESIGGYHIQVREYLGEQVFDVIHVPNVRRAGDTKLGQHETLRYDQLETANPELPNRMAALTMLDNGAFVEGLGMKISDTTYWVLV